MKIRMEAEDGDLLWFSVLEVCGASDEPDDWASLIDKLLRGSDCSDLAVIQELIISLCNLPELRTLKSWLDACIANRDKAIAQALASDATCESKGEE